MFVVAADTLSTYWYADKFQIAMNVYTYSERIHVYPDIHIETRVFLCT